MSSMKNLTGMKFERLTVTKLSHIGNKGRAVWEVVCICGTVKRLYSGDLISGNTRSCGCLRREVSATISPKHNIKHGLSNTPEWNCYAAAKDRCTNPKSKFYKHYGARGIRFLFPSFIEFIGELGPKPDNMVLDRIENNGHYEVGNVRWATWKESNNNKRMGNQWKAG